MNGTALVTGGAKRVGRAIALGLADKGFHIALHYRSAQTDAEEVAREIEQRGKRCHILINNASIFERARFMETDEDLFDRHFTINFKTPFFLSRDFARHCDKGQIINILDTKISRTLIQYFVYSLTKKTFFEFTRMAAVLRLK